MTQYKIMTKVKTLERVERIVSTKKVGEDVIAEKENLGWFVGFEGSWERLHLGMDPPELKVGQTVEITIKGL